MGENLPIVEFSVFIEFFESEVGDDDEFRWSAFNLREEPLFKFNFDMHSREISYSSDGGETFDLLGFTFGTGGFFHLLVTMNFERNLLTASLNNVVLLNGAPMTTTDAELTLGDIDAVWVIFDPDNPGDNFMLFDDYAVTAANLPSIPSVLETVPNFEEGSVTLTLFGEPDLDYRVEESADLTTWTPVQTIRAPGDGIIVLTERLPTESPTTRFFRAVQTP